MLAGRSKWKCEREEEVGEKQSIMGDISDEAIEHAHRLSDMAQWLGAVSPTMGANNFKARWLPGMGRVTHEEINGYSWIMGF
jgi:hypothetical protein